MSQRLVPAEVAEGTFQSFWRHDFNAEMLAEIEAPIMAINADFHDNNVDGAEQYGIEMILMSGVGHSLMREDAATFNGLLEATVERFVAQGVE